MSVCPTNQKAAFLNKRGTVDFRCKTDWGYVIKLQESESRLSFAQNPIGLPETNENRVFEKLGFHM
jgi:hypothetical protein